MKIKELKEKTEKFECNKEMISNIEMALRGLAKDYEPPPQHHVPQTMSFSIVTDDFTGSVDINAKVTELVRDDLTLLLKTTLKALIHEQDSMEI